MIEALIAIAILSLIISRWSFFKFKDLPVYAIIIVFLLKIIAGYLSFKYHNIYFAGGDGAIYLQGGKDLLSFSGGNPILFIKLFFNMNRGLPEWESIYSQIIYWDSKSSINFINDNRNAIRLNSLINLLSFNNLGIHLVLLNFLSIIGLTALYKSFRRWFPTLLPLAVFVAVFLSPSILFWTSGILKETHTILFVGFYMLYFNKLFSNLTIENILLFSLSAFLLLLVRDYFAIVLYLSSIFITVVRNFKVESTRNWLLTLTSILILAVLFIIFLPENLVEVFVQKQQDFIFIGQNANSYFSISPLTNASDIILHFPEAFINVFLQPQLFTFNSWLYIFPVIENIDILFFCILALIFKKTPPKESHAWLWGMAIVFILSFWLIGLTVPIQGAIARYKSLSQPFLLIFIFSFIDWDVLKNKFFLPRQD